jgi:polysaccharide export outer membrane protein
VVPLIVSCIVLFGCASRARPISLPPPIDSNALGPGDVFILHIVGERELPTEYTVAPDGTVDVPYVHRVKVGGLESQQVSALVREKLMGAQILTNPSVTVMVKAFHSKRIVVGGEVKQAGAFPFEPGMTLQSAIAKAGGMTSLARTTNVVLIRATRSGARSVIVNFDAITLNEIPDIPLQAGDRITVPQRIS